MKLVELSCALIAAAIVTCCGGRTREAAPLTAMRTRGTQAPVDPRDCSLRTPTYSEALPLGAGYVEEAGSVRGKVAYLTFDDGPSEWTSEFLDILKAKAVHATFFVVAHGAKGDIGLDGSYQDAHGNIVWYRDVLRRIVDEGHALGNHTENHRDLGTLEPAAVAREFDENEDAVNRALVAAGSSPRLLTLLRAPFGSPWRRPEVSSPDAFRSVGSLISQRGLNMLWDIDSTDSREWAQGESVSRKPNQVRIEPNAPSYAEKMARIRSTVLDDPLLRAGYDAIILFHDTHNATRDVLAEMIQSLIERGYSFRTLEEYAQTRWRRPSVELTPGPRLFDPCVPERAWGCVEFPSRSDASTPIEVCGRSWRAFSEAGGEAVLGAPLEAASYRNGKLTQRFAQGVLELPR